MPQAALTRCGFVAAAAAGVAALAVPRARAAVRVGGSMQALQFHTEPAWSPPRLRIRTAPSGTAPGLLFLTPFWSGTSAPAGRSGPLIVAQSGTPIWFQPLATEQAHDLRVQTYRGERVLTWFESSGGTYGGSWVIADTAYRELVRVHAGHGYQGDLHEFQLTSAGTALVSIANQVGQVVEGVIQEIDVASGAVVFEWHSLDHVPVDDSYRTAPTSAGNVDYFHLNSIDVDSDGNLLVSSRHTSTVYKLDRKTGAIIWRLGGKRSDFSFEPGAAFNFQHDARHQADGTLTVFDNGATEDGAVADASRGLRLRVDVTEMSATLVDEYVSPRPRLAVAMGNVQVLPNGNVLVGWGTANGLTEFGASGNVLCDARFADGSVSYRAFRLPWTATPEVDPRVFLSSQDGQVSTVYASWNGATDVALWQVISGPRRSFTFASTGFETPLDVPAAATMLQVVALDSRRRVLGQTRRILL